MSHSKNKRWRKKDLLFTPEKDKEFLRVYNSCVNSRCYDLDKCIDDCYLKWKQDNNFDIFKCEDKCRNCSKGCCVAACDSYAYESDRNNCKNNFCNFITSRNGLKYKNVTEMINSSIIHPASL